MVALRINRSLMAHSSTSPSHSKKTQPFHFRATFETEDIELVVKIGTFHQHNIELSIKKLQKKQSYNTQEIYLTIILFCLQQTKDLKCATHLLSEKFRNMSEEKKTIVRDLGFGGLIHIPPLRVHHQLLRELANNFKLEENRLEIGYGSFKIRPKIIGDALGINASERNWSGHVLSFIIKGISDYKEKKKKAIDGCLFALMIIYFHLSKNNDKKRAERPPKPWIANWSKEQLVERMRVEIEKNMASSTSSLETETTDSDNSTSESETQEKSEDSLRKEPSKKGKKMESKKRKKNQEDSDSESKSTDETQSKNKKVVVEDSSPEQPQSYHGYSTLSEIGSEDLDELLRENNKNSVAHGEKEADLRSTEGHYVSSEM
ncbi:hypothetical protein AHAS_Ahas19G0218100 [Arachis hypogaea]